MFETDRLILRARDPDLDHNFTQQCLNDATYHSHVTSQPLIPRSHAQIKDYLTKSHSKSSLPQFVICEKKESLSATVANLQPHEDYAQACGKQLGCFFLFNDGFDAKNRIACVKIGFLREEDRGKGYGTEVLRWGMEYAFMELGLHRVQLDVYSFNTGAMACYRKVGFVEEGRMRKTNFKGGQWYDTIVMAILDEEWLELRKSLK